MSCLFIYPRDTVNSIKKNPFYVNCAMKQFFCPSLSHLLRSNEELLFENTVGSSKLSLFVVCFCLVLKERFRAACCHLRVSDSKMPSGLLTGKLYFQGMSFSVSK